MKKTEYFCDRCWKNVTHVGGAFGLREIIIRRDGMNYLQIDVCDACSEAICAVAAPTKVVPHV